MVAYASNSAGGMGHAELRKTHNVKGRVWNCKIRFLDRCHAACFMSCLHITQQYPYCSLVTL